MARSYTLAQKLRDPNKRKLLPISVLPAAMQAQRKHNQLVARDNANPLYDPGATLSGHALATAAQRLAALAIDPQIAALNMQDKTATAQNAALAGRAAGYSGQLDWRAVDAQAREQALADRLNAALAGVGQRTQDTLSQAGAQAQAALASDASLRGTGLEGGAGAQVQDELAAARARAATDSQAYGSSGAVEGANYEGLMGATRGAQQLRGQEYQQQIANELANERAGILSKKAATEATRGDETLKNLLQLREQGFTNQATSAGLGLKSQTLAADTAAKAADRRTRLTIAGINQAERDRVAALQHGDRAAALAFQKRRDSLQRKLGVGPYKPPASSTPKAGKPASGPGSLTPEQEQRTISRVLTIQRILDTGTYTPPGAGAKPVTGLVAIKDALAAQNVDPRVIAVAESLHRNHGKIGPYGIKQAKRLGLHVGGNFSKAGRPRKQGKSLLQQATGG